MSNYHPEDVERMEFIWALVTINMDLPKTSAWKVIDIINHWNRGYLTINIMLHIKTFEGKVIEE